MPLELTARTEPGKRLVALAERLADEIGPSAAAHDRDGSFPFESFAAVKESGYFTAPIPEELGGLGVTSVHDVLVGSSRLARGDAALTLGVNMHLVYLLNVVRRWQIAVAADDERRAGAFAATLEQIARDGTVFAAAGSEPGQDLTRPATTATRTSDGWIVSGRKVFCTMAPAADVLYTAVTYTDGGGRELYGYAMVPREAPGVVVHDDWDALGMRASGSHSVSFEDVPLPSAALRGGFPVGDAVEYMERNLTAGLFHTAAALGIAEKAYSSAAARLGRRHRRRSPGADAGSREPRRPVRLPRPLLARRRAHRRAPCAQPDVDRHAHGGDEPVRRGAEREGLHQRRRGSDRRPGAGAVRRGRLPERQPACPRLSRRPRHRLHAPARQQPRLRVPRSSSPRAAGRASTEAHECRRAGRTHSSSAPVRPACRSAGTSSVPATGTPCSNAAGWASAGARNAGTRSPCSPPTGSTGLPGARRTPTGTASSAAPPSVTTSAAMRAPSAHPCTSTSR